MLNYTDEAKNFKDNCKGNSEIFVSIKDEGEVKRTAVAAVKKMGGNIQDEISVLGQYEVQFGMFKGKTFKWLTENCLGYSAWLVDNMRAETTTTAPLSRNKHCFKCYLTNFQEGQSVVALKAQERVKKASETTSQSKISSFILLLFWVP